MTMDDLKTKIRHVPDFPKAGILFYDITTLLQDADGFRLAIDGVSLPFRDRQMRFVAGRLGLKIFLISLAILFAASLLGFLFVRIELGRKHLWPADLPHLPRGRKA